MDDVEGQFEEAQPVANEQIGETEGNEETDGTKNAEKKEKKKKGNWKTIGHEPVNYELHPCLHKYEQKHPRGPCIQYKQVRWILLPLSDRLAQLALPLLRRLLALWLEFGDKFPPEMRARLLAFLVDNYGLTAEFLEQILEEARKEREEAELKKLKGAGGGAGKGKKSKKGKRGKKKKKGKKKGKKGKKGKKKKGKDKKKKEKKEKSEKPKKKEPSSGLLFKRRKAGKLPLDWPYKMGSKFLLKCISYLSKDPDEDYNSRASEYFDVQSMAILEQICTYMDMSLPDPERPTQYGETLVIMALNLTDWIAQYVTTPAQAIPDDKVEEYLELKGAKPKPPKKKKEKAPPKKKGKKGKTEEVPPEPVTEIARNWNELKAPVYVPEKSRISKRKGQEEEGPTEDVGYSSEVEKTAVEAEVADMDSSEGVPRWNEPTLDDVKKEFLEYINWYNPWEPEFMYFGPRLTPVGVQMFNIWDENSTDVPCDLRVLNWNQIEYGFTDNYSFIPSSVPQYYPALRPLRPIRLEDLERSGIPKCTIKRNLRFFSPWFLMSKPLKPPPPPDKPAEEEEEEVVGEYEIEEVLEDEMLTEKPKPVKDSLWGDYKMREQIEIIAHILHMMCSVPDLTIEYVFEQLEEFCDAVECAEEDENPSEENRLLLKKRTIILERYFLEFFSKKFRDYNDRSAHYMRVLCSRCAYYIQILYEYTARILWELQSRPNPPTPPPSRPETPDDPEAIKDWNEWLAWLLSVTKTCDEWAGWITDTVNEAERKAAKKKNEFVGPDGKKVYLTAEEWFGWKKQVERKVFDYRSTKRRIFKESPIYLEKAKNLLPVKHREVSCRKEGEFYGEGGEGEEEVGVDIELAGEELQTEVRWMGGQDVLDVETGDETEWEDVGEVE